MDGMVLWAQYGITHLRYGRYSGKIEKLEVVRITGDRFEPLGTLEREEVVRMISRGYRFCTVVDGESPVTNQGRRVNLVQTKGSLFLRTDEKVEPGDCLGDLPEF
jgi:hypothetical protein